MMESPVRAKFGRILIFLAIASLYLVMAASSSLETAITTRIGQYFPTINIVLLLFLVINSSVILLINLYSYGIFREVRYLLFTFASLMLTVLYGFQLLQAADTIIQAPLTGQVMLQLNLIITIAILMILLGKLFLVRHDLTSKLPLRQVPVILGLIIIVLVSLYFIMDSGVTFNNQWILAILFLLTFSNILGYLIKYVAGDQNAESLLFVGIVHLATFAYPSFGMHQNDYIHILANSVRLLSLLFMTHTFYTHLFRSYIGQMVEIDRERVIYTTNLEQQVVERTEKLQLAYQVLEAEIDSAKELQKSMMAAKEISFGGVSFISENVPCDKMSGDFFDIYEIDENRVGMYILDVSGHGINAALMNIYCYHYIRSTSPLVKRFHGDKPSRNLLHLYEEFNKMSFPDEMHIVLFIAAYDMRTKKLTYCSGGLNSEPIVVKRSGEIARLNQSSGFPIVKMGSFFTPDYTDVTLNLETGDRIIFYTDGLIDQRQPTRFTEDDLMEVMLEYVSRPLAELDQAIMDRIDPVRLNLIDDISFFIMEVGR